MAQSDIWFPLYVGDYMADTLHLSTIEHGAYFLILCAYYKNHGPLPDDDQILSKIARLTHSDWLSVRLAIRSMFKIECGKLIQTRADFEIQKIKSLQAAKREGARITNQKLGRVSHSDTLSDTHSVVQSELQSESHTQKQRGGENGAPHRPPFSGNGKKVNGSEIILRHDELKRVEKAIQILKKSNSDSVWTQVDKDEIKRLRDRRTELLSLLGMSA